MSTEKTLSELLDEYREAVRNAYYYERNQLASGTPYQYDTDVSRTRKAEQHARRAIEEEYGKR